MDFEDRNEEHEGLPKWPFLASSLFILTGALGYAYYHYHQTGMLEVWQLLVCILASGIASLLICLPFLLEQSLQLCLQTANRKDDELFRKVYFDLKELRNDIESLSVKTDKVPTLVDKIISDSLNDKEDDDKISKFLLEFKEELALKLARLEELALQEPIPVEPDPGISNANKSLEDLTKSISSISNKLNELNHQIEKLPKDFPEPVIQKIESKPDLTNTEFTSEEDIISQTDESDKKQTPTDETVELEDIQLNDDSDELIDNIDIGEDPIESLEPENLDSPREEFDNLEVETPVSEDLLSEEPNDVENPIEEKPDNSDVEEEQVENPEELDLGLPDPEETLRKVDALLSGSSPTPKDPKATTEKGVEEKNNSQITSVVANVMIGIGNKPYVRGEGPGLSWEQGIAMNFVEIGKWAWSPSRKNASLTIQIYRNDEDPDKTGKHEIKPGEKFEITPEF